MTDNLLSPERCAAIRAELKNAISWLGGVSLSARGNHSADQEDRRAAIQAMRDLLAVYDQITLERDNSEQLHGDGHAFWQGKFMEQHKRAEAAEAALVVLTQRQEQAKWLIDKWRETGAMVIDVSPIETGYNLGLRVCADGLETALAGDGGQTT